MPSKHEKIASICFDQAINSKITIKHGAVATCGSKIICKGHNLYNRTKILDQIHSCTHAEMDVANQLVQMLKKKIKRGTTLQQLIKKYKIYVVRIPNDFDINKYGKDYISYRNSSPCTHCRNKLLSLGFKTIYYSDSTGNIVKKNLNDIDNNYETSSQKTYGKYFK